MRKLRNSKACPSHPLLHKGYRNGLYLLTVQLIIHKESNVIKDLSEKALKGLNLNLNTLTLHITILLFKWILQTQIYLKKPTSLLIPTCTSYHRISLEWLYTFFYPSSQIMSTSVDRRYDCAVTFIEGEFCLIYSSTELIDAENYIVMYLKKNTARFSSRLRFNIIHT